MPVHRAQGVGLVRDKPPQRVPRVEFLPSMTPKDGVLAACSYVSMTHTQPFPLRGRSSPSHGDRSKSNTAYYRKDYEELV